MNPFEDERNLAPTQGGGAVAVESNRAIAEVQAQVIMARHYPRNQVLAMDRILQECERVTLAERAIYSYPKGGTQVSGPSIRLAEAIARAWGNMAAGVTEVERVGNESQMLAYAWDLETNTVFRREFKVKHLRDTKEGPKALRDERDVYELTANQGARRLRACILATIPGDVVDAAVAQCERTMTASVGDLPGAIKKMVEKFQEIGVTKQQIEARLGHRIDATQAGEIVGLRNIYNSIRDGLAVAGDFFHTPKEPEDYVKPVSTAAQPPQNQAPAAPQEEPTIDDLWGELTAFAALPTLPAAARKEIQEANSEDEKDPEKLKALLAKVRTAAQTAQTAQRRK